MEPNPDCVSEALVLFSTCSLPKVKAMAMLWPMLILSARCWFEILFKRCGYLVHSFSITAQQ